MLTLEQATRALVMGQQRMIDFAARIPVDMQVYPEWTMKEVIDHLTGWDEMAISLVGVSLGNGKMASPIESLDEYNAMSINRRKMLPLRQSIEEYVVKRKELVRCLVGLQPGVIENEIMFAWGAKGTLLELLNIWVEHEESHRNDIFGRIKW